MRPNKESKALEFIDNLRYEPQKRHIFTYEEGKEAEKSKASTSLKRAKAFITEIRMMIEE
jgi:uncharacterized protein (UPF0332 family)